MSDIAEKLLSAIGIEEAFLKRCLSAPVGQTTDSLARLSGGLRRCAADREIVDEYRKAVESHKRRPEDAVLFERHLCWKVALEIAARGYGLETAHG